MDKPLLIYVAGPYTAEDSIGVQDNVNRAIDHGIKLFMLGHLPYIPHLTHFVDRRAQEVGVTLKWEDYIEWDLAWLERSDAVLCLGNSPGVNLELARARELGKPIYRSIDDIPRVKARTVAAPPLFLSREG